MEGFPRRGDHTAAVNPLAYRDNLADRREAMEEEATQGEAEEEAAADRQHRCSATR